MCFAISIQVSHISEPVEEGGVLLSLNGLRRKTATG